MDVHGLPSAYYRAYNVERTTCGLYKQILNSRCSLLWAACIDYSALKRSDLISMCKLLIVSAPVMNACEAHPCSEMHIHHSEPQIIKGWWDGTMGINICCMFLIYSFNGVGRSCMVHTVFWYILMLVGVVSAHCNRSYLSWFHFN